MTASNQGKGNVPPYTFITGSDKAVDGINTSDTLEQIIHRIRSQTDLQNQYLMDNAFE